MYYTIFILFVILFLIVDANFFAAQYATAKAGATVPDIFDFFGDPYFSGWREYATDVHLFWSVFLMLPVYAYLVFFYPRQLVHFLSLKILLVAVRMLTINMTYLGKVAGQPAISGFDFTFGGDLFFSGHVAYSFLLYLILKDTPLRYFILSFHIVITAATIVGRFHYAIDIVGAYAIAYSAYKLTEPYFKRLDRRLAAEPA